METYDGTPIKTFFLDFFSENFNRAEISQKQFLALDIGKVWSQNSDIAEKIETMPDILIPFVNEALSEFMGEMPKPKLHFFNPVQKIRVVDISSDQKDKLFAFSGVIIQTTTGGAPILKKAVMQCTYCDKEFIYLKPPMPLPTACEGCKRKGLFLNGKSEFTDIEKAYIQDFPEAMSATEEPKVIEALFPKEFINKFFIGQRVEVSGICRLIPPAKTSLHKEFGKYIEVLHVERMEAEIEDTLLTPEDIEKIKQFSQSDNAQEMIIVAFAPHIKGCFEAKLGLILAAVGGESKDESARKEIHCLLLGDPASGKTQLILELKKLILKSVFVDANYATKSGLGVTTTAGKDGRSWTMKAGAAVLADKGLLLLDEIGEFADEIKVLNGIMEQGRVSAATAGTSGGMRNSFPARCTIIATANPKFGKLDMSSPYDQQIGIPASTLSRFDLRFLFKEQTEPEEVRGIAKRIIERFRGNIQAPDREFIRKYIAYAKKYTPVIDDDIAQKIENSFVELAGKSNMITPRQEEGLVRIATAHAKLLLHEKVNEDDVRVAVDLYISQLKQFGTDTSTGTFDVHMLESGGKSLSQSNIEHFILDQLDHATNKRIGTEELITAIRQHRPALTSSQAESIIEQMCMAKQAKLYRPQHGVVGLA